MSKFALVVDNDHRWAICEIKTSSRDTSSGSEYRQSPTPIPDGVKINRGGKNAKCIVWKNKITKLIETEQEAQQIFDVLEQATLRMQRDHEITAAEFRLKLNMVV